MTHNAPDEFARLVVALRALQDRVAQVDAPPEALAEATAAITGASECLAAHIAPRERWTAGTRHELVGRGQTLVPAIAVQHAAADTREGTVSFGAFHHGSGGYVNASAAALVFVETMGLLAYGGGRAPSRMARLQIDYKAGIRINTQCRVDARLQRVDGRKLYVGGSLRDGDLELAAAEALFVVPR